MRRITMKLTQTKFNELARDIFIVASDTQDTLSHEPDVYEVTDIPTSLMVLGNEVAYANGGSDLFYDTANIAMLMSTTDSQMKMLADIAEVDADVAQSSARNVVDFIYNVADRITGDYTDTADQLVERYNLTTTRTVTVS